MAQIFISHSQKDEEILRLFKNAFVGTNVKAVFESLEKAITGNISRDQIKRDIENSRALFVILSQNVEKTPHTRDWVVCESGFAKNKDVWVFEPYSQFGTISVIIPFLRNYVIFSDSDAWLRYIRRIIESYDDSQTLQTVLTTGGLGAIVGSKIAEDEGEGAFWGGIGGAILGAIISDKTKNRPVGLSIECAGCNSIFNIHIPQGLKTIRCPICNETIEEKV